MKDITSKQVSLRTAKAVGVIFCEAKTIDLIQNNGLPKGNLFDVAKAAGFIGAKLTPQLLPHCHPVQIDGMDLHFEFLNQNNHGHLFDDGIFNRVGIVIFGEAKSIGRTGLEMEMLTTVTGAALEIYDMLKPVDTGLEIGNIRLIEKRGGKSDRDKLITEKPICAILVCSDTTAAGKREDASGLLMRQMLEKVNASIKFFEIVSDDKSKIQEQILAWVKQDIQFIFTTGGTGFGPRDVTVEAVEEILELNATGITEAIRNFGQQRTPLAMMSRAVAGVISNTLIVTLPGSTKGVKEGLEAILPAVFHATEMIKGNGH
jgi:molybdenum cofactor biosynthesis protein MoaC